MSAHAPSADELERERDRALAELQSLSYAISHDLRAPLRAVDGFAHALVLDHGDGLAPEARQCAERVRQAAAQLTARIDGLLELARIGQAPLHHESVSLHTLARRVAAALPGRADGRPVEIALADDLPDAWGDPALLRLVLDALLSNAVKATSTRADPQVRVAWRAEAGAVAVSDNGIGFDMRYAPQLFRMFGRLHRTQDFPGEGIGLALAARAVHRHGGEIWAESEPDAGATLAFTLPAGTQHEDR